MRGTLPALLLALVLVGCSATTDSEQAPIIADAVLLARSARCAAGEARVRWFDTAAALAKDSRVVDWATADRLEWAVCAVVGVWLGQRPTAGYGLEFISGRRQGESYEITVRREQPAAGTLTAQIITYPCVFVSLPRGDYRRVRVLDAAGKELGRTPAGQ